MKLLIVLVRKIKTASSEQVPFKISLTKADTACMLHQAPSSPISKFVTGKDSAVICE